VARVQRSGTVPSLGAICNAVSGALANLVKVTNVEFPRVADFARFGYAACLGLGWNAGVIQRDAATDYLGSWRIL
jgi:hypothetical protein